jgi:hypothetical protein
MTMKTRCLFLGTVILGSLVASGQNCKPDEVATLPYLQSAVHRFTKDHIYTGFDDKAFSRAGDLAGVAILQAIPEGEFASPDTLKEVLSILRLAFGCPSRCVVEPGNRQPNVTLLLLEHLHNRTQGSTQAEIDETRKYVLQQTNDAK